MTTAQTVPATNPRIIALEGALYAALEYIEEQSDVVDGDYGEPKPNRAMRLAIEINEALSAA